MLCPASMHPMWLEHALHLMPAPPQVGSSIHVGTQASIKASCDKVLLPCRGRAGRSEHSAAGAGLLAGLRLRQQSSQAGRPEVAAAAACPPEAEGMPWGVQEYVC